jgi:glycosyltransferase involved in cell wall biosynthesis
VPLVLDLHEAMPEFFRMRFPGASRRLLYRLLLIQERVSIGVASAAITVNDALADRLVDLGVARDKITVILNSSSLVRFDPAGHPRRAFGADGTLRLVYAGALTPVYELDVVIAAVDRLRALRPEQAVTLDLYGRGDARLALEARAAELGLADRVTFHGRIPFEDVPAAIAGGDIGLAPTRREPFTDLSLSTKIFEYAAMAKPVVASRLPMVERTFTPGSIHCYEPGDPDDLARTILTVVDDGEARTEATRRLSLAVRDLSWEREADRLVALVDRLAKAESVSSPS